MKVAIIGLGYVGMPLMCAIARNEKYNVVGFDLDKKLIERLRKRKSHIEEDIYIKLIKKIRFKVSQSERVLKESDVFIICVPTPIHNDYTLNYDPIKNAANSIAKFLKKGNTVILESTVNPGTCEEIILPILESTSKLKGGRDFILAHCPERINPGDKKWSVFNIPRNVGALTRKGTRKVAEFYRSFLDAEVNEVSCLKVAEATKIVENTFRDVNIAFVNELAQSFDKIGIDLIETIKCASSKPFAFMPHWPGCGVGGHCIAIDPYYLIKRATKNGFNHRFLKAAREVNNSMPDYTVSLLTSCLNNVELPVSGTKIALLGLSYKGNVGDLRESPAIKILEKLKGLGAKLKIFDPYVHKISNVRSLPEAVRNARAIVVCTDHEEFKKTDVKELLKNSKVKVVIDGRNIWDNEIIRKLGIIYKGIGR